MMRWSIDNAERCKAESNQVWAIMVDRCAVDRKWQKLKRNEKTERKEEIENAKTIYVTNVQRNGTLGS